MEEEDLSEKQEAVSREGWEGWERRWEAIQQEEEEEEVI